jgi:hypothetical protein
LRPRFELQILLGALLKPANRSAVSALAFVLRLVVLSLSVGGFSTSSFSAEQRPRSECPDWATPDAPIWQRYGWSKTELDAAYAPPFTAMAYFWAHGTWLEFPLGYKNPWPGLAQSWVTTDRKKYITFLASPKARRFPPGPIEYTSSLKRSWAEPHFVFWMPSLRYFERNTLEVPSYRPCEAGRPPPTESEYLVGFRVVWPFLPNSGESEGARVFRVQAERLAAGRSLTFQDSRRTEHTAIGPISGEQDYKIYADDGDLVVNLRCDAPVSREMGRNPLCAGHVWQRPSNLILFLSFPSDQGQIGLEERWRAPVKAAIDLVSGWRR